MPSGLVTPAAGGATPNLSAVLAVGNTAGHDVIVDGDHPYYLRGVGSDVGENDGGASSLVLGSQVGSNGGRVSLVAGAATALGGAPGDAIMAGGSGWGGGGGRIQATAGGDASAGKVAFRTNGTYGATGQTLASDGANDAVWSTLGAVKLDTHAAPADGTLAAGELYLWFDQTNGAAKLMVKAKQANGTVVTASVNLA